MMLGHKDYRMHVFQHPFSAMVVGPSHSGKTHFVKRVIEEGRHLISEEPRKVLWYYGQYQTAYADMLRSRDDIEFHSGLPENFDDILELPGPKLLIIDDLMDEAMRSEQVSKLFTRGSHHADLSVIALVQNIFHSGTKQRDISLNTTYLVLFKTIRDRSQIYKLGYQMFPTNMKFFKSAFEMATKPAYGYLFCDLAPCTNDEERLSTNIFMGEQRTYYVPI